MDSYFFAGLLVSAVVVGFLLGVRKLCMNKWGEEKGKRIGDRIAYAFVGLLFLAIILFVVSYASGGGSGGGSGSGSSKTCPVCGRSFSDTTNVSSIRRRNMCVNCYSNYQWGQKAAGRGTASHHDGCGEEQEAAVSFRTQDDAKLEFQKKQMIGRERFAPCRYSCPGCPPCGSPVGEARICPAAPDRPRRLPTVCRTVSQ